MKHFIRTFAFASAVALSTTVCASEQAAPAPEAEPEKPTFILTTATCGDVYDLYEDATPGEGKDPKEVAEAQDDVLYLVVWVHGYLSGRNGVDLEKRPLGQAGIEKVVAEIDEVCKPDKSKRFLDAAMEID